MIIQNVKIWKEEIQMNKFIQTSLNNCLAHFMPMCRFMTIFLSFIYNFDF